MLQVVFVDANILASRVCLDWLFQLQQLNPGMFRIHCSEDVIAEAMRALRRRNPRLPGAVTNKYSLKIRKVIQDITDDFSAVESFTGRDENDYHVHAAAIAANADLLLTNNNPFDISSDPDLESYEIISADDFFNLVVDSNPDCLFLAARKQYEFWKTQPGMRQLDQALSAAGCPNFAKRLSKILKQVELASVTGHDPVPLGEPKRNS